jgi:heme A synthase
MVESVLRPGPTPAKAHSASPSALTTWGVAVTGITLAVVLFGAVVRVTGSGAGCGQHWPTCHGEIVHLPKAIETWIELGHRATSGLSFLAVLALVIVARQRFAAWHPARLAATGALALMVVEVLIGARLVLLNLVGSNLSIDRVVVMPAHLVTTSFLLGCLVLTTYFGSEGRLAPVDSSPSGARELGRALRWIGAAAAGLLLVSTTGAITALGDTVYPVRGASTLENLALDHAADAHLLGRLRALHPLLAIGGVALLWVAASRARAATEVPRLKNLSASLMILGGLSLVVGTINVVLGAPGYMQIIHLLVACLLWMGVVLSGAMLWDSARGKAAVRC